MYALARVCWGFAILVSSTRWLLPSELNVHVYVVRPPWIHNARALYVRQTVAQRLPFCLSVGHCPVMSLVHTSWPPKAVCVLCSFDLLNGRLFGWLVWGSGGWFGLWFLVWWLFLLFGLGGWFGFGWLVWVWVAHLRVTIRRVTAHPRLIDYVEGCTDDSYAVHIMRLLCSRGLIQVNRVIVLAVCLYVRACALFMTLPPPSETDGWDGSFFINLPSFRRWPDYIICLDLAACRINSSPV